MTISTLDFITNNFDNAIRLQITISIIPGVRVHMIIRNERPHPWCSTSFLQTRLQEHNLNIMAEADYIVDMGPEAGPNGGKIVAKGSPENVMKSRRSKTAKFLQETLSF